MSIAMASGRCCSVTSKRRMEEVNHQATSNDPLLSCCLCRHLLQDAVQLTCLHNCCRQCFSAAALAGNCRDVICGTCKTVTLAGRPQPNGFIDSQVKRHKLIVESGISGKCRQHGEHDKPATVWCLTCRHSLCEGCVPLHGEYFKQHVTQSLDELKIMDEVLPQKSLSACPTHQMPLDIACRNCEQTKCINCWAECTEEKHEMHVVGNESFDGYIGELVACIFTTERELLQKSEVHDKPKTVLIDTKSARDRHLEDLKKRKRHVMDAVEMVYQEMEIATKNAYDSLEAECDAAAAAASCIGSHLSDAQSYIHRLIESNDKCEILKQQKFVRERLNVLSSQLDALNERLTKSMGKVEIEASLPDDMVNVIRVWIGMPHVLIARSSHTTQSQQPEKQQSFSFGVSSVSVSLPVRCNDVSLTTDGRSLLFAAGRYGLLEFCSSSGRELSYWLPPERKSDRDSTYDSEVSAVAALSNGRAAASLKWSKLVVLLRQGEQGLGRRDGFPAAPGDEWTEEHRVALPWDTSTTLSGHENVLAVWSLSKLELISTISGRRLSNVHYCDSNISSVAVAARVLVTAHKFAVEAHSIPYGQRLWRHGLEGSEVSEQSVCSDSSGGYVYAAVCRSNWSMGHLSVLSLADGGELRRFALRFDTAAAPQSLLLDSVRLSLREDSASAAEQMRISPGSSCGRVLELVALDAATTSKSQTIMVHRSTSSVP